MNETQEYLDIMAGKKRLELEYKAGEVISGYTATGLSAKIIESLHCGQYIPNWGFMVDHEFADGDIERMKRHFFEWQEMEAVKAELMEQEVIDNNEKGNSILLEEEEEFNINKYGILL